jgi:hypothetical protein
MLTQAWSVELVRGTNEEKSGGWRTDTTGTQTGKQKTTRRKSVHLVVQSESLGSNIRVLMAGEQTTRTTSQWLDYSHRFFFLTTQRASTYHTDTHQVQLSCRVHRLLLYCCTLFAGILVSPARLRRNLPPNQSTKQTHLDTSLDNGISTQFVQFAPRLRLDTPY